MTKQSTLGSYIRSLRLQHQMTQAQLAEKVHVTDKAVSKWERDISFPDIALFPKLADLFGVTVDDLLRECIDENQPSRLLQIFEMSSDIRTPLHIILGCADIARSHTDNKEQLARCLESIRISGEYLLQVMNRIMQMTNQDIKGIPEAGQPEIEKDGTEENRKEKEEAEQIAEAFRRLAETPGGITPSERSFVRDYDFSGKRILIAEDMAMNREIAGEILKQTGAAVEFAENGRVCVQMMAAAPPGYYDLILMDIRMPDIDGVEATRTIRQLPDREKAAVPIIAMTANVYEKDRYEAFDAGMNAFTEKPILTEKLFETIDQYLNPKN